jgi:FKBP-type peptidyl-prolyl cis-trans isomerase 2
MKINKGDFIELDYTAKITGENIIFDTTIPEDAAKAGLIHDHEHNDEHGHEHNHLHKEDLKPVIICVGEKQVLPSLDGKIEGLELGKHTIALSEEEAFGKKDTKLLKLMPMNLFKKQEIRPFVGLALDMDGSRGVVRSISGGRVIVDFNHQLAGKKIEYALDIKRIVTDKKEQLESFVKMLRFPYTSISIEDSKAKINTSIDLPKEITESLEKDLKRITLLDVKIISDKEKTESKLESKIGKEEKTKLEESISENSKNE